MNHVVQFLIGMVALSSLAAVALILTAIAHVLGRLLHADPWYFGAGMLIALLAWALGGLILSQIAIENLSDNSESPK